MEGVSTAAGYSAGGFVFQVYGLDLLIDELYNDIYKKDI